MCEVADDEIRQMRQVLQQINFDRRLQMTGIDDSSAAANPEPSFDPHSILRSLERQRARSEGQPPDRAQELFYRAMDAPNAEESLALLEQALTLDPENVDALLAVLGHQQLSPEEQIPRLRRVVELAQKRLGEKASCS